MTKLWTALTRGGERVLEWIAAAALIAMMLHIVANALLRSYANSPITGTNEYVGYWYLPLVAFLGFVVAQRRDQHIEARLIFDRLPARNRREFEVLGLALVALTSFGFAWYGGLEAVENFHIGLTGGVTGVVIWPVTFVVPVAFGLLGALTAVRAVAVARGRTAPDGTTDAGATDPRAQRAEQ